MRKAIEELDPNEAKSIKNCQELLKCKRIPAELTFINSHLSFLPGKIKELEENGLPMTTAMGIMDDIKTKLETIPAKEGEILRVKYQAVLSRNPGHKTMKTISKILKGDEEDLPPGMTPEDVALLKYCPLVTAEVERSFSRYKLLVSERRMNLKEENIQKMMIVNWFCNRSVMLQ